ncbi:MAG: twin-arginine translocase TatA/TatE family subunit [Rariglobus sp.]|nr:twin-arginine translocase TatA/TatE family subunit [Rariglobus sp.]
MNTVFNPTLALLGLGTTEIMLILAIVILLFGAKKLPELAKGLGKSIKEFKKASNASDDEEDEDTKKPASKSAPTKSNDVN